MNTPVAKDPRRPQPVHESHDLGRSKMPGNKDDLRAERRPQTSPQTRASPKPSTPAMQGRQLSPEEILEQSEAMLRKAREQAEKTIRFIIGKCQGDLKRTNELIKLLEDCNLIDILSGTASAVDKEIRGNLDQSKFNNQTVERYLKALVDLDKQIKTAHDERLNFGRALREGRLAEAQTSFNTSRDAIISGAKVIERTKFDFHKSNQFAAIGWEEANEEYQRSDQNLTKAMQWCQIVRDGATMLGVTIATAGSGTALTALGWGRMAVVLTSTLIGTAYGTSVRMIGSAGGQTIQVLSGNQSFTGALQTILQETGEGAIDSFKTAATTALGFGLTQKLLARYGTAATFFQKGLSAAAGNVLGDGLNTGMTAIQMAVEGRPIKEQLENLKNGIISLPFSCASGFMGVHIDVKEGKAVTKFGQMLVNVYNSPYQKAFTGSLMGIVQSYCQEGKLTPEAALQRVFSTLGDIAQAKLATDKLTGADPRLVQLFAEMQFREHPIGLQTFRRLAGPVDDHYVARVSAMASVLESPGAKALVAQPEFKTGKVLAPMLAAALEDAARNPARAKAFIETLGKNPELQNLLTHHIETNNIPPAGIAQLTRLLMDGDTLNAAYTLWDTKSPALKQLAVRCLENGDGQGGSWNFARHLLEDGNLRSRIEHLLIGPEAPKVDAKTAAARLAVLGLGEDRELVLGNMNSGERCFRMIADNGLLETIQNPDSRPSVRTLKALSDPEIRTPVKELLAGKSPAEQDLWVARLTSVFGDPALGPVVAAALKSGDHDVRLAAKQLLDPNSPLDRGVERLRTLTGAEPDGTPSVQPLKTGEAPLSGPKAAPSTAVRESANGRVVYVQDPEYLRQIYVERRIADLNDHFNGRRTPEQIRKVAESESADVGAFFDHKTGKIYITDLDPKTATKYQRVLQGSVLAHEDAHAKGGDELVAWRKTAEYLQKNGYELSFEDGAARIRQAAPDQPITIPDDATLAQFINGTYSKDSRVQVSRMTLVQSEPPAAPPKPAAGTAVHAPDDPPRTVTPQAAIPQRSGIGTVEGGVVDTPMGRVSIGVIDNDPKAPLSRVVVLPQNDQTGSIFPTDLAYQGYSNMFRGFMAPGPGGSPVFIAPSAKTYIVGTPEQLAQFREVLKVEMETSRAQALDAGGFTKSVDDYFVFVPLDKNGKESMHVEPGNYRTPAGDLTVEYRRGANGEPDAVVVTHPAGTDQPAGRYTATISPKMDLETAVRQYRTELDAQRRTSGATFEAIGNAPRVYAGGTAGLVAPEPNTNLIFSNGKAGAERSMLQIDSGLNMVELRNRGIDYRDLDTHLLSHFHADHSRGIMEQLAFRSVDGLRTTLICNEATAALLKHQMEIVYGPRAKTILESVQFKILTPAEDGIHYKPIEHKGMAIEAMNVRHNFSDAQGDRATLGIKVTTSYTERDGKPQKVCFAMSGDTQFGTRYLEQYRIDIDEFRAKLAQGPVTRADALKMTERMMGFAEPGSSDGPASLRAIDKAIRELPAGATLAPEQMSALAKYAANERGHVALAIESGTKQDAALIAFLRRAQDVTKQTLYVDYGSAKFAPLSTPDGPGQGAGLIHPSQRDANNLIGHFTGDPQSTILLGHAASDSPPIPGATVVDSAKRRQTFDLRNGGKQDIPASGFIPVEAREIHNLRVELDKIARQGGPEAQYARGILRAAEREPGIGAILRVAASPDPAVNARVARNLAAAMASPEGRIALDRLSKGVIHPESHLLVAATLARADAPEVISRNLTVLSDVVVGSKPLQSEIAGYLSQIYSRGGDVKGQAAVVAELLVTNRMIERGTIQVDDGVRARMHLLAGRYDGNPEAPKETAPLFSEFAKAQLLLAPGQRPLEVPEHLRVRDEAELARILNGRSGAISAGDVAGILDGFPQADRRLAAHVLDQLVDIAGKTGLDHTLKTIHQMLRAEHGDMKIFRPDANATADFLAYAGDNGLSGNRYPFTSDDFKVTKATKKVLVILDESTIAFLSTPAGLTLRKKILSGDKSVRVVYPVGLSEGITGSDIANPAAVRGKVEPVVAAAKRIMGSNAGMSPAQAIQIALENGALTRLAGMLSLENSAGGRSQESAAPTGKVTTAMLAQVELACPHQVAFASRSSADIAEALNGNNPSVTPTQMRAALARVPEEWRPLVMGLVAHEARTYSMRDVGLLLASQRANITAALPGVRPQDITYVVPDLGKSFGTVTRFMASFDGTIKPSQIVQLKDITSGKVKPAGPVVILDDFAGSGNSLRDAVGVLRGEYEYNADRKLVPVQDGKRRPNSFTGQVVVAPLVSSTRAVEQFAGISLATDGNTRLVASQVISGLTDRPDFQALPRPVQNDVLRVLGGEANLGFAGSASMITFPWGSPNNNCLLFTSCFGRYFTGHSSGVKKPADAQFKSYYEYLLSIGVIR